MEMDYAANRLTHLYYILKHFGYINLILCVFNDYLKSHTISPVMRINDTRSLAHGFSFVVKDFISFMCDGILN